mmetsp:Transcript_12080/g.14388  ORF Transcript_12080/g.14388 Transcript_12080/m.14388 type:complete len:90 (-) Transcript_12080:409-678(-)
MEANFEPAAFAAAFPGKPLAGFLAQGEIFGEHIPSVAKGSSRGDEDMDESGDGSKETRSEETELRSFMHGFTAVYGVSSASMAFPSNRI